MEVAKVTPVNLYRLSKITDTTESIINFVKDVGLIPKTVKCPTCSAVFNKPYYVKKQESYTNSLPM